MAQETKSTQQLWNEFAETNNAPTWNGLDAQTKMTIIDIHFSGKKEGIKIGAETIKKVDEILTTKNK